jgi:hypothetical protein
MAVIELSKPGQEATTYELLITVNNAALTVSGIIATQLLVPLKAVDCSSEVCTDSEVDIDSGVSGFEETDGPERYTNYTLCLIVISISCALVFIRFLPKDKAECQEWKAKGLEAGISKYTGYVSAFLSSFMVIYGFVCGILLLDSETSCLAAVGGSGC